MSCGSCLSCFLDCSLQPGKGANLLALLFVMFVMFACGFVTFPYGFSGQVWYLIVSIPDLCLLTCLEHLHVYVSKLNNL